MGRLCSRSSNVDNAPGEIFLSVNGHIGLVYQSRELLARVNSNSTPSPLGEKVENKEFNEPFSYPVFSAITSHGTTLEDINDGIPLLSRALSNKSRSTKSKHVSVAKVSEVSSPLGKVGTVGFGKSVDLLDMLDSSMANLNLSGGFTLEVTIKGNKISILAFEVANTIVKGFSLMQSLSTENIRHLKEAPADTVKPLYLQYAKLEEDFGLAKRAMKVYDQVIKAVPNHEKLGLYKIYIAWAVEIFGVPKIREIYEQPIESGLPNKNVKTVCLKYAELEKSLGEIDRAYIFASICRPKI